MQFPVRWWRGPTSEQNDMRSWHGRRRAPKSERGRHKQQQARASRLTCILGKRSRSRPATGAWALTRMSGNWIPSRASTFVGKLGGADGQHIVSTRKKCRQRWTRSRRMRRRN
eukprot:8817252-Pyramimonas_sp.AAC.1